MKLQLKQPTMEFPPDGGFSFIDPRTGFRVNGLEGTIEQTARKVSIHRQANPTLYPPNEPQWFDIESVIQELFEQKNRTHPHLFIGAPDSSGLSSPKTTDNGVCICGESQVEPIYCAACGGSKITGYRCVACKAERSK